MSIKIASMNFGDCDTILHNTSNGMKNIAEVLGPNGEVYWSSIKELTGIPPLSIRSNGTMLLDYLISGNMTQTGTPTPTTPIQPQETGERTGNLFDADRWYGVYKLPDGTYQATYAKFYAIKVKPFSADDIGRTFTFSMNISPIQGNVRISANVNGTVINGTLSGGRTIITFTVLTVDDTIFLNYGTLGDTVATLSNIMLNTGSTALPYEPYGYKIPISSANTTTPVYLGEVETTRKIGKIDLGTLNWSKTGSGNFWADTSISNCRIIGNSPMGNAICTHLTEVSANNVANTPYSFSSCLNTQARPFVNKTGFENMSGTEFKEAMSGVYMYYVLATPKTGIVNEPLRKIGDYADTVSMEQAGMQIPTLHGNTIIDVDTTLKPSQMYIKYK